MKITVTLEGDSLEEIQRQMMRFLPEGEYTAAPLGKIEDRPDPEPVPETIPETMGEVIDNAEAEDAAKTAKKTAAKKKAPGKKSKAKAKTNGKDSDEATTEAASDDGPKQEPEPTVEPETPEAIAHAEALDVLLKVYQSGDKPKVLELLESYGVKKFTEVPVEKGIELLEKAQALT